MADKTNPDPKTVRVNSWVKIAGFEPDEEETYEIVDDATARPMDMRIGESSPLAQALLGKEVGETVNFHSPAGRVQLTIVDLGAQ